jgi:multiple sugar transport system substrate-binding protein
MRVRAILLAAALAIAPLAVRAADLVVWWEGGFNPEEDQAVKEIMAAFEQKTSKQVELVQHSQNEMPAKVLAALEAGHPPDFLFGTVTEFYHGQWAYEGRLIDLADALGPLAAQFDQDALGRATKLDGTTGRRGLHALPMGRLTEHVHVWKNLLEQAGLTLEDIPEQWEPFWSFWCDTVQPAVREATGRDDIYGVGLAMSSVASIDVDAAFGQFVSAYRADYVTRDGKLVIDEPEVRASLVEALAAYTAIWRKGCTPPASLDWDGRGNNEAFLARRVVMTLNNTLTIPNALKATRPDDYYRNAVTLGWPDDARGQPLAIYAGFAEAVAFRDGGHAETAREFVRFLVGEGWLAHWFDFTAERWMPPMRGLLQAPFWLDPGDPHRMAAVMQLLTRPSGSWDVYAATSGNWRHGRVGAENVWSTAIHRVVTEGITPGQAVDEAIARIKQILSE